MIAPYWEDREAGLVIYNNDCREVLPMLATDSIDLLLTDPPYINLVGGTEHFGIGGVGPVVNASMSVGDPWDADLDWMPEAWRIARLGMMVFCSFASVAETRQALPDANVVGLVTWHKRNSPVAVNNVPRYTTEFIWLFKKRPGLLWRAIDTTMFDIPKLAAGCVASPERLVTRRGKAVHPTQKPVELIERLLLVGGQSVCDPFMGVGTTLVAAKKFGRRCIGIDIEERWCELAANRLRQSVLPLSVMDAQPAQLPLDAVPS